MGTQTPEVNDHVAHAAAGNLAFLLSVIRSGETLSADEEAGIRQTISRLEDGAGLTVLNEVGAELAKARATHAPMNGHHEGYAVILEELDELWEVCKKNTHGAVTFPREAKRAMMRKEAIQVAAMAVRFIEDVCGKDSVSTQ